MDRGDLLVLYTDGITEAEDPDEEEFGVERLVKFVASLTEVTAEQACAKILETVDDYTKGAIPQDDVTLLVVERLGEV